MWLVVQFGVPERGGLLQATFLHLLPRAHSGIGVLRRVKEDMASRNLQEDPGGEDILSRSSKMRDEAGDGLETKTQSRIKSHI